MTFRFKLFRSLTGLNLFVSGFFLMMSFFSLMFMASLSQGLIGLLVLGAVCIHSILSLYLQRSLLHPGLPLKPNTPSGIRIMGWMAIIYACSVIASCIFLLSDRKTAIGELVKQLPEDQRSAGAAMINSMLTGFMICLMLYAVAIIINCFLSFSFLRQWQRGQQQV